MGNKLIIYPLTFVGALAVIFFLVVPTYKDAKALKETEIKAAEEQLAREQEITKNLNSLQESYESYKSRLTTLKYSLPEDKQIKDLIVQIEAILLDNQLFYETIDLEESDENAMETAPAASFDGNGVIGAPPTFSASPEGFTVNLTVTGTYESILRAITQIESLTRLIDVTSLSIEGGESEDNPNGTLTTEIELKVYYEEPVEPAMLKQVFESASASQSGMTDNPDLMLEGNPDAELETGSTP